MLVVPSEHHRGRCSDARSARKARVVIPSRGRMLVHNGVLHLDYTPSYVVDSHAFPSLARVGHADQRGDDAARAFSCSPDWAASCSRLAPMRRRRNASPPAANSGTPTPPVTLSTYAHLFERADGA